MILSRKIKESIKTALAMTIAIGIALWMDWEQAMWAGFAVAMISLATIGQSLSKGLMRMFGTLLAAFVALSLITLFPQERWLFMLFLSLWVGLCTYMMGGAKNQYFWHVSAFACTIICMSAGIDPVNAFNIAMLRTQETGLGILVYSLVAIFLWPSDSYDDFREASRQLASTQQQLFRTYRELISGQSDDADKEKHAQALCTNEVQQQTHFVQLLAAVEIENYEIWESRYQWANYRGQVMTFSETMQHLSESLTEIKALELQELLPELEDFSDEVDERLSQLNLMLAGEAPTRTPEIIELVPNPDMLNTLSYFHKAAFSVLLTRLKSLEPLTRTMYDTLADINNFSTQKTPPVKNNRPTSVIVPDTDRLLASVRVMIAMWLAYLALIYINDIPAGVGIVSMIVPIGMALATMPQLPVSKLLTPVIGSVFFVGLLYIFLMPKLSTYLELGLLIFSVTFAICYLFSAPQQVLGRAFGLAIFLAIAAISNDQIYSFLAVANTALMFAVVFIILAITTYIPFSPRPERAFLRLLGRFFRCSEYLLSTMKSDPNQPSTRLESWRKAFYARELAHLPNKLAVWGKFINTETLSGSSPEQVRVLTTRLQALTYRLQELFEARGSAQAEFLVQELLMDIRAWRIQIQKTFQQLSKNPTAGNSQLFRTEMLQIIDHLDVRIKETVNKLTEKQLSAQEDGSTGEELLPNIKPTFKWIRLAQRLPVKVILDELPEGVKLRVGSTVPVLVFTDSNDSQIRSPTAVPGALK